MGRIRPFGEVGTSLSLRGPLDANPWASARLLREPSLLGIALIGAEDRHLARPVAGGGACRPARRSGHPLATGRSTPEICVELEGPCGNWKGCAAADTEAGRDSAVVVRVLLNPLEPEQPDDPEKATADPASDDESGEAETPSDEGDTGEPEAPPDEEEAEE